MENAALCYVRCACSLSIIRWIQVVSASPHKLEACFVNLQFNCLKAISVSVVLTIWKSCWLHQYLNSCRPSAWVPKKGKVQDIWDWMCELETSVLEIGGKREKAYLTSTFPERVWKYQVKFTGVIMGTCQAQSYVVQELMWQELQGHNFGHSSAAPRGLAPHFYNFVIPIEEKIFPRWAG